MPLILIDRYYRAVLRLVSVLQGSAPGAVDNGSGASAVRIPAVGSSSSVFYFDPLAEYFVCNAHFVLRKVMTLVDIFPRNFLSVQNPGTNLNELGSKRDFESGALSQCFLSLQQNICTPCREDSLVQTILENFSVFEAAEVLEIARAVANAGVMPPWIQSDRSIDLAATWRSVSLSWRDCIHCILTCPNCLILLK